MKNISRRTIFRKMIKLIDGEIGKNLKKANNEYKYSKRYAARDHLLTMLFLQISGCTGLRDIDCKYRKAKNIDKELKIPTYSHISRLNKSKSSEIFRCVYRDILRTAERELKSTIKINVIKDIKIIDSSIINISAGLAPELECENDKSSVRISSLFPYGTKLPSKITIVPAKIGERKCIDCYADSDKNIYLFDKGYYKYSWYDKMTDENIKFVTRQQSNAVTEEYFSKYTGIDDVYDCVVTMGTDYSKNKTKHKYREILYFSDDSDEEFRLVTNIFDMPADDIISLYKNRWDIELFFKWIKQHLTIKRWVGNNLNAVSTHIYSALIVYILLLLIKNRFKVTYSLYDIVRKIMANLLQIFDIGEILLC